MKAALICLGKKWTTHLPTVLYGIRATPCDDTGISRAEMAFGKTLRLPGEFFEPVGISHSPSYVTDMREAFQRIGPDERKRNFSNRKIFVPKDLFTFSRVFIRVDKIKAPLTAPYDGPYRVIKRTPKWFEVEISEKSETVSIDCLKPEFDLVEDSLASGGLQVKSDQQAKQSILKKTNGKEGTQSVSLGDQCFFPDITTHTPNQSNPISLPNDIENTQSKKRKKLPFKSPISITRSGRSSKPPKKFDDCVI